MFLKNVENGFMKSSNASVKNTPEKLAGMAQTRLVELKSTNSKILLSQKTKVYKQERPQKMRQHPFLKSFYTGKASTPLVTQKTSNSICNLRPTNYILLHLRNNMQRFPLSCLAATAGNNSQKTVQKNESFQK